jgi:hypothetical protein
MDAPTSEETPDKASQYIASMTQELAELARRNGLETLSRILEMARLEAISAPSADDIISVLRPIMGTDLPAREHDREDDEKAQQADPEPDDRARIVALLSPTPVSIDDLIRLSRTSPRIVRAVGVGNCRPDRAPRRRAGFDPVARLPLAPALR